MSSDRGGSSGQIGTKVDFGTMGDLSGDIPVRDAYAPFPEGQHDAALVDDEMRGGGGLEIKNGPVPVAGHRQRGPEQVYASPGGLDMEDL